MCRNVSSGGVHDIAIVRMEQMYPFPAGELRSVLTGYPESAEVFSIGSMKWESNVGTRLARLRSGLATQSCS